MSVRCTQCDAAVEGEAPPLTWVWTAEDGASHWLCDACSRAHVRSVETKLDPEWW